MLYIFYSYFGGLELIIQHHLALSRIPDYQQRRKANTLITDIDQLSGKIPALAPLHFLPDISSHAQAMGALYVIEGSTLGGRIITQMITSQLAITDGLAFFGAYAEETMAMWLRFLTVLNQEEELSDKQVIEAANETFLKFSEWFDVNT